MLKKIILYLKKSVVKGAVLFMALMAAITGITTVGAIVDTYDALSMVIYLIMFSLAFGVSMLAFEVKALPLAARYILNFVLLYGGFVLFFVIMPDNIQTSDTIPILSVFFAGVYAACSSLCALALFFLKRFGLIEDAGHEITKE